MVGNLLACAVQTLSAISSMKSARHLAIVLVTAPDLKTARVLVHAVLRAKLIACANLFHKIESHYWWQGKIERSAEVLILFKTTKGKLAALEKLILAKHPYDTPEFITLPLGSGTRRYIDWVTSSVS